MKKIHLMDKKLDNAAVIAHEFLQSGVGLPFSSDIGPRLLSLSSQPIDEIDIDKLVQLIQLDPGLTTKVLQLANSVYFAGIQKIVSLRRAIIQIGLEEAINFIHAVYYKNSLPRFPKIRGFSDKDYWSHSWACAVANKMLGHPSVGTRVLPGELYITGLLHGLGKLVLAIHRPEEFLQCLQISNEFQQPLPDSEQDILGTTDADIACELLKTWQLPLNICNAIKYFRAPEEAEKQYREIAGLTQLAYYIANTSGIGNTMDEFCYDVKQTWITNEQGYPLSDEAVQESIVQEIYSTLERKSTSLAAFGGEEPVAKTVTPQQQEIQKRKGKQGVFDRLMSWLQSLLR